MRRALPGRRWAAALLAAGLSGCLLPGGEPELSVRDETPPRVLSTQPDANGRVAKDGQLKITFSERMDPRSLAPGILLLSGDSPVAFSVSIPPSDVPDAVATDAPYAVWLTPAAPLRGDAPYTLVLRTLLADTAGNPLVEELRVGFFTQP